MRHEHPKGPESPTMQGSGVPGRCFMLTPDTLALLSGLVFSSSGRRPRLETS